MGQKVPHRRVTMSAPRTRAWPVLALVACILAVSFRSSVHAGGNDEGEKLFRQGLALYLGKDRIDYREARRLFREAGAKGHVMARASLGWMMYTGLGGDKQQTEGLTLIKQLLPQIRTRAQSGDSWALFRLGALY